MSCVNARKRSNYPTRLRERIDKDLSRLASMPSAAPETGVIRTYVDWLLDLPWAKASGDNLDIQRAARLLEASHYGLPKAKERILEHIAVYSLAAEKMKNPVLCFVGPPGYRQDLVGALDCRGLGA